MVKKPALTSGRFDSAQTGDVPMRHFDSLLRLSEDEVREIMRISADLKARWNQGARPQLLEGRVLTLLFEKPSLRTRISFEAAITHLGGNSVFMSCTEAGLNGRESLADVARVLAGYSDWIAMRTFSHQLVEDFMRYSGCPVINGLSDGAHPCQALADLFTIQETFGSLAGKRLTYIGDGNNVARSLAVGAALMKMPFIIASPLGYELTPQFLSMLKQRIPTADITLTPDPAAAVARSDVVYVDVWTSMGQENEHEKRKAVFAPYQVNAKLMAAAPRSARFMHCLPAKRGMEVTDDVMDGAQSIVFEQAENRMHIAKGLLVWLLGSDPIKG